MVLHWKPHRNCIGHYQIASHWPVCGPVWLRDWSLNLMFNRISVFLVLHFADSLWTKNLCHFCNNLFFINTGLMCLCSQLLVLKWMIKHYMLDWQVSRIWVCCTLAVRSNLKKTLSLKKTWCRTPKCQSFRPIDTIKLPSLVTTF